MTAIFSRTFEMKGSDLKEAFRARREFEADRNWNGLLKYMAHADGYVMVRRLRALPFVLSEKSWRDLPAWPAVSGEDR
jgi:hypothetical protein